MARNTLWWTGMMTAALFLSIGLAEEMAKGLSSAEEALLRAEERVPDHTRPILEKVLQRVREHRKYAADAQNPKNLESEKKIVKALKKLEKATQKHLEKLQEALKEAPEEGKAAIRAAMKELEEAKNKAVEAIQSSRAGAKAGQP